MVFLINSFEGEVPRTSPRLLRDSQSQNAINSRLFSGELDCWQGDRLLKEIDNTGKSKTLYNYEDSWVVFNTDVDIAKAPIIADEQNRIVLTGLGKPKITDKVLYQPNAPFKSYTLGIPSPSDKVGVTLGSVPDGAGISDTVYSYTYVRKWSDGKVDEGPLAPPTDLIELYSGQEATLAFSSTLGSNNEYGVSHIFIYRTAVNTKGEAQFQFVDEIPITDISYKDTKKPDALGEVNPSSGWKAPPDDLKGILTVGTGMLAGFSGNTVHISDVFQAHGWPDKGKFSVDFPIVGLGSFQNTLIILTEDTPYIAVVQDPETFTLVPFKEQLPCMSKRSVVSTAAGVIYAAHNGLILVTQQGPRSVTNQLFDNHQWEAINPSSLNGFYYDNQYFFFWSKEVPYDDNGVTKYQTVRGGFILNLTEPEQAVTQIIIPSDALYRSTKGSKLYYTLEADGRTQIYEWEGVDTLRKHYTWKSKEFVSNTGPVNLSAARVQADYSQKREKDKDDYEIRTHYTTLEDQELFGSYNDTEINNFVINGDRLSQIRDFLVETPVLNFKLYVDGALTFEKVLKKGRVFRLPAGIRGTVFEVEVEGNIPVFQIQLATNATEIV